MKASKIEIHQVEQEQGVFTEDVYKRQDGRIAI